MTKPFSIELVNCILERPENKPDWKFFQVTFDGYAEERSVWRTGRCARRCFGDKDSSGTAVIPAFADGGNNTGKPSAELFHDVDAESPAVEGGSVFSTVRLSWIIFDFLVLTVNSLLKGLYYAFTGRGYFVFRPWGFALPFLWKSIALVYAADDSINTNVLDINDRKNIDLSQFTRSYIMPGVYTMVVHVNKNDRRNGR